MKRPHKLAEKIGWTLTDPEDMRVKIFDAVTMEPILYISIHEIIESSSRKAVMDHIKECDNSPWLRRWQEEKHNELIELLKQ